MSQKRFLGFTLILFGMLISFSRIVLTGAVIGIEASSLAGIIGATIALIGAILVLATHKRTLH